jgi:tetratricopeptide (TPR) repeat protein
MEPRRPRNDSHEGHNDQDAREASVQNLRDLCVLLGLVFVIFVAFGSSATAQIANPDTETLSAVRRLIDTGHSQQAIEQLKTLDTTQPLVAHLLALAYYHADDHVKAIELLSANVPKLAEGSLERREAEQILGLSLYAAGRLAEALPYLEATRKWAADNLELNYVLGLTYLQTRKIDAARPAIAVTFGVPAGGAAAHLLTAQMLIRLNLNEAAADELTRGLEKDPRLPQTQYLLGQMALFRGRLDESADWTKRELEINPGNAMAWYQLGDVYVRQSKWDEAIATLQRSLWINPFYSGPYILLGRAYIKKEQPSTAEGMLRRAIEYDPNNRTAHYVLAQLLQQMGRSEEAKTEFAIAEKLQGQTGR